MNIEIANRFQQLRKMHGLSQEELASRIGVSRQAVSKWERAEASPDTDNLILLSQLYGISLDELLKTGSVHLPDNGISLKKEDYGYTGAGAQAEMFPENYTDNEIYPQDNFSKRVSVPADRSGAKTDGKSSGGKGSNFESRYEKAIYRFENGIENKMDDLGKKIEKGMDKLADGMESFGGDTFSGRSGLSLFDKTFPLMIILLFALMTGIGLADPGWTVFLLLPLYYTFKSAVKKKSPMIFCYPVLCAFIYFFIGGLIGQFRPRWQDEWYGFMWLIFLTIPLYYTGYYAIKKRDLMIFCYPVLCVLIYLGIGLFTIHFWQHMGEVWFAVAWIPLLASIPFYYIVILHFRQKRCKT